MWQDEGKIGTKGGNDMKFNLSLSDIKRINELYEAAEEFDVPLALTHKNKPTIYMMNEETFRRLSAASDDQIREKEIKHQAGKSRK